MNQKAKEEFELVAKRCPKCESLVMARVELGMDREHHYTDYHCSRCDWKSPVNGKSSKN